MVPEISEFSYGFALTNEIVGWGALTTAPIFPSLIEEGKAGGGYDVLLNYPGFPLYLQFKRAECMFRKTAKQAKQIKGIGGSISVPFYRFGIMENWKSAQHEMLLQLDNGLNQVFYAAPRFHKIEEINSAWTSGNVAQYSIFVSPQVVGSITDSKSHSVAYDDNFTYFCSDPKLLYSHTAADLLGKLQARLQQDDRPLREVLPEALAVARHVRTLVPVRGKDLLRLDLQGADEVRRLAPAPTPRPHKEIEDDKSVLRELADIASQDFHSQLLIVQSAK